MRIFLCSIVSLWIKYLKDPSPNLKEFFICHIFALIWIKMWLKFLDWFYDDYFETKTHTLSQIIQQSFIKNNFVLEKNTRSRILKSRNVETSWCMCRARIYMRILYSNSDQNVELHWPLNVFDQICYEKKCVAYKDYANTVRLLSSFFPFSSSDILPEPWAVTSAIVLPCKE